MMEKIPYKIVRRNRKKTVQLVVASDNSLTVYAPRFLAERRIDEIVRIKSGWIEKRFEFNRGRKIKPLTDGQTISIAGRSFILKICRGNSAPVTTARKLLVFVPEKVADENVEKHLLRSLETWGIEQAKSILPGRVEHYAKMINRRPGKITVKKIRSRWGSCSSVGNLNFNWRIVLAPVEIIDYVVVHELCHMIHLNHSRQYWETVESFLPDYKKRRLWLKENEINLHLNAQIHS